MRAAERGPACVQDLRFERVLRAVVFLEVDLRAVVFRDDFFAVRFLGGGTLPPALRASDKPIAIACLRLVTFFPEPPLRKVPSLRSFITLWTFSCAFFP